MKRSVYSKALLLGLSFSILAQPMLKAESKILAQVKQFTTALNHFKECAMRKRVCTQAEKATIGTSLVVATYFLIISLLAFKMKYTERRLRDDINGLVLGDPRFFVKNVPYLPAGKALAERMIKIDKISDYEKRIELLEELKSAIERQRKVK